MIYLEEKESNEIVTLQIPRSERKQYAEYQIRLLNGQTKEIYTSTPLTENSGLETKYSFNLEIPSLQKGYYYYQILFRNNETEDFKNICETGLLQYGSTEREYFEYQSNNVNKVYLG
jgi:hypothetical protein